MSAGKGDRLRQVKGEAFREGWERVFGGKGDEEAPLFIPLRREYFEAFERGEKTIEYRKLGPRWNEETCRLGRRVTLSLGYGKQRRLYGVVTSFHTDSIPGLIPGWEGCFGDSCVTAACIGIKIDGNDQHPAAGRNTRL